MVTMALRPSFSPESRLSVSRRSTRLPQRVNLAAQIGLDVLAFAAQIEIGGNVVAAPHQVGFGRQHIFQALFLRMTCWDFCGFDQRAGSAACFSISASCSRSLPASKVLPEITDFVLQAGVFLFELFIHD